MLIEFLLNWLCPFNKVNTALEGVMVMLSYDPIDRTLDRVMEGTTKPWLYGPEWQGQRCEARTRKGTLCQRPGSKISGRCKLHGGRSTGPTTDEGIARLAALHTTHRRTVRDPGSPVHGPASQCN